MLNKDEIIRMAREAGCYEKYEVCYFVRKDLERFFNLAFAAGAAHEREKQAEQEPVAITIMANGLQYGVEFLDQVPLGTKLYAAPVSIEAAVLAEREACAKVCDEKRIQMNYSEAPYNQCAAAIRARGE